MSRPEPKSWDSDLLWDNLTEDEQSELIQKVNPIDGERQVTLKTTIEKVQLPFYPENIQLIRMSDKTWSARLRIYYLQEGDNLFRLQGASPPIHDINAKAPIQLNELNALAYLRFFCFFVHGSDDGSDDAEGASGPFFVLESLNQSDVPDILDDEERAILEENAYPARFNGVDDDGKFLATAIIWLRDAIFAAQFKIHQTGMIEMDDDEMVLNNLKTMMRVPLS